MGADRNHLRLDLQDKDGRPLKLVAFFAPDEWLNLDPEFTRIEPLIMLTENDWNGIKSCEACLLDPCILPQ